MQCRGVSPEVARQMLQQSAGANCALPSIQDALPRSSTPAARSSRGAQCLCWVLTAVVQKTVAWLAPLSGDPEGRVPRGNTAAFPSGSRLNCGELVWVRRAHPIRSRWDGLRRKRTLIAQSNWHFRAAGVPRNSVAAACLAIVVRVGIPIRNGCGHGRRNSESRSGSSSRTMPCRCSPQGRGAESASR